MINLNPITQLVNLNEEFNPPPVPKERDFLVKGVNFQTREKTLCQSQGGSRETRRTEEILGKYLERLDPFVRGSLPIAWVDQDEEGCGTYSYTPRKS
jgi:hypothetical protein